LEKKDLQEKRGKRWVPGKARFLIEDEGVPRTQKKKGEGDHQKKEIWTRQKQEETAGRGVPKKRNSKTSHVEIVYCFKKMKKKKMTWREDGQKKQGGLKVKKEGVGPRPRSGRGQATKKEEKHQNRTLKKKKPKKCGQSRVKGQKGVQRKKKEGELKTGVKENFGRIEKVNRLPRQEDKEGAKGKKRKKGSQMKGVWGGSFWKKNIGKH